MKRILSKSGFTILIDDGDFENVNRFKWHVEKKGFVHYALRREYVDGKRHTIFLHRYILGVKNPSDVVDHKNHDGLDNRRENLRICTQTENNRNTRIRFDTSSGYKGVGWFSPKKKWRARIQINKKRLHLGYFDTKEKAHLVYSRAAQKYFGQFAA